jgi:hypothetical protein
MKHRFKMVRSLVSSLMACAVTITILHSRLLEYIRIHQLLLYGDENLLGDDIDDITKNAEILIDASNEVGLGVNADETNLIFFFK